MFLSRTVLASGYLRGKQLLRDGQHGRLFEPHWARRQIIPVRVLSEPPLRRRLPVRILSKS